MFHELLEKYRSTSDLNRFLIKGGLLYIPWRVFQKWLILKGQYTEFTNVWATIYLRIARFCLSVTGWSTEVNIPERKLWLVGANEAIQVEYDCLGVNLLFVFAFFVIAYFGKTSIKLWFIPLGMTIVFLLNALRMAALTVVVAYYPQNLDLFHHFIFQGMIYLVVLCLWWVFHRLVSPKH
jgi:exosortase/archaeosortase family protein